MVSEAYEYLKPNSFCGKHHIDFDGNISKKVERSFRRRLWHLIFLKSLVYTVRMGTSTISNKLTRDGFVLILISPKDVLP
jgi:hypothetical protein